MFWWQMEGVGNRLQVRKMLLKLNNGALMKKLFDFYDGYFFTLAMDWGGGGAGAIYKGKRDLFAAVPIEVCFVNIIMLYHSRLFLETDLACVEGHVLE